MRTIVDFEDLNSIFDRIVNSEEWIQVEKAFKKAQNVFIFGHGGNMGVADHASVDISRLTDKNVLCPGSGVIATSLIADNDFNSWTKVWLEQRFRTIDPRHSLVVGLSCSTSGESSNSILNALEYAKSINAPTVLIAAQAKPSIPEGIIFINQDVEYYHTSECISLALTYQLTHSAGFTCPSISKKTKDRRFQDLGIVSSIQTSVSGSSDFYLGTHSTGKAKVEELDRLQKFQKKYIPSRFSVSDLSQEEKNELVKNFKAPYPFQVNTQAERPKEGDMVVPPGHEEDLNNIAIDFDGVIHNMDRGWHDGTCYGDPLPGALEAIRELYKKFNIIVFTAKARPDRPLVNGKTGVELVEEWLIRHDVWQYVDEVTYKKPRAQYYIDDKALHFTDWETALEVVLND